MRYDNKETAYSIFLSLPLSLSPSVCLTRTLPFCSGMEAYVTLVTSDSYVPGALVLGHRLRDLRTTRPLACLITPGIADHLRELLANVYDELIDVDPLETTTPENLQFLGRPDLGLTFTKLHLWRLSRRKLVFLDADTLPLRNVDELFQRPSFSAAPDAGWPDCFNSGVFVMEPSEVCYRELVALAAKQGSFDGKGASSI